MEALAGAGPGEGVGGGGEGEEEGGAEEGGAAEGWVVEWEGEDAEEDEEDVLARGDSVGAGAGWGFGEGDGVDVAGGAEYVESRTGSVEEAEMVTQRSVDPFGEGRGLFVVLVTDQGTCHGIWMEHGGGNMTSLGLKHALEGGILGRDLQVTLGMD